MSQSVEPEAPSRKVIKQCIWISDELSWDIYPATSSRGVKGWKLVSDDPLFFEFLAFEAAEAAKALRGTVHE